MEANEILTKWNL